MAAMNHTVSGISAIAETRCIHHWWTPLRAEPSPIARESGVRMLSRSMALISDIEAGNPGNHRHRDAGGHDGPPRHIDRPKFKSVYGVPYKVSDAAEKMQKKRE